MSKNRFRKISKSVHKIAKSKYFTKVITYSKSPDNVLQSYIYSAYTARRSASKTAIEFALIILIAPSPPINPNASSS